MFFLHCVRHQLWQSTGPAQPWVSHNMHSNKGFFVKTTMYVKWRVDLEKNWLYVLERWSEQACSTLFTIGLVISWAGS